MASRAVVGRVLGHYRVIEALGAGGMGEVYRARDMQLERDVAIKILPSVDVVDPTARARLLREARTAAQLNHPNICTIYEVGECDGEVFIAMELVTGQPLNERLRDGPLPSDLVLRSGLQLAEAVGHAHQHNVIHRDLKSSNVMVTTEGRVKVLDFGLAKQIEEADLEAITRSRASLTQPGAIVGTLGYMSPEQLRGQPADERSDVWALGVVLYEMASGKRPFAGATEYELVSAALHQPPASLPASTSAAMRLAIERCLEKEPARRYQSAAEVRSALEAIQTGSISAAAVRYRLRRRRGFAVALAILLVAGITTGLMFNRLRERFATAPHIESLAVLPLENLSGDPAQEYFADGITEELITDLGRLTGLKRVIARGSVMRYKGTRKTPGEIARELNVDALITGAVLRSGQRVRVTAQLVNPQNEEQLWTQSYERDLSDVLRLQSELTSAIASQIRLTIQPEEKARLANARTVNPEAYEAYLQGEAHWQKLSPKELDTAEKSFQLALQKDPNYALAYAGLGIVWARRGDSWYIPPLDAAPKWREAIAKGLDIDPTLPELQVHRAAISLYLDWDWATAGREFQRAMKVAPNYPEGHIWYAWYLMNPGRQPEEAINQTRIALELDPHNVLYRHIHCGMLGAGRHDDEAISCFRQLIAANPNWQASVGVLAQLLDRKHMYDEAFKLRLENNRLSGNKEAAEALQRGYARGGYSGALIERAKLYEQHRAHGDPVAATAIAALYAQAGKLDLAMDWLDTGYKDHELTAMVQLPNDARWEPLHNQPRFKALLKKMNFPE